MDIDNIQQLVRSFYAMQASYQTALAAIEALSDDDTTRRGRKTLNYIEDGFIIVKDAIKSIAGEVDEYENDCLPKHTRDDIEKDTKKIEDIITGNAPPKMQPIPNQPVLDAYAKDLPPEDVTERGKLDFNLQAYKTDMVKLAKEIVGYNEVVE